MEQRDPEAMNVGAALSTAFADSFRSIRYTLHPSSIPGEAAGKSSNISWAARKFSSEAVSESCKADRMLTVVDGMSKILHSALKSPCRVSACICHLH